MSANGNLPAWSPAPTFKRLSVTDEAPKPVNWGVKPYVDLDNLGGTASPQMLCDAARYDDDRRAARDPPQGAHVEVIPMRVRDEHDVDPAERVDARRLVSPQVEHLCAQERVGQQAGAVELEQDGRMADVCHASRPSGSRDAHDSKGR